MLKILRLRHLVVSSCCNFSVKEIPDEFVTEGGQKQNIAVDPDAQSANLGEEDDSGVRLGMGCCGTKKYSNAF